MKIGVLGSFDARMLGVRVRLPASQRVLLAALAVRLGDVVTVDALIEVLWGDRPPATCRQQLYKHVSALREVLGDDVVLTEASGYLLNTAMVHTDLRRFEDMLGEARRLRAEEEIAQAVERYRAALSVWRGPALADVESQSLRVIATRFDERRLGATEECAELQLRLGQHSYVIDDLRAVVAAHPFHERLTGLYILALYRGGRQAEALDTYHWMRARLVSELGVEPSEELQRLHESMLRHDPVLDHDRGPAELTDLLASGRSRVALLTGPAGTGKTALATQWSDQVRARFPDGSLYLDLHGSDQAVTAADALAELLRALGEDVPADFDARSSRYQSVLRGTRTLVVLDDAADVAQIEPLLPGAEGCFAVVTSRGALDALDAERVRLGLPQPRRPQARESLRVWFEASCADASEPAQRLLRYLSIVPCADFSIDAVTALLDAPDTHARLALAELDCARLIEQHLPGRFRLHDVVKLFVRSRIVIEDDIRVIAQRLLWHYVGGVDGAVAAISSTFHRETRPPRVVTRQFPDQKAALVWLHQEHANLVAAVRWANEHGQDALCAHLVDALRCFFWFGYAASEWISTAWTGLDAAERLGDVGLRAAMHHGLGQALAVRGEVVELTRHYGEALKYAEELRDPLRRGHVRQSLGLALMHTQPVATSEELFRTALDIALVEGNLDLEISSRVALAEAQVLRGRLDVALTGCDIALAAMSHKRLSYEMGTLRGVRGRALVELGRLAEASQELDAAVELHARCGNRIGSMYELTSIGLMDLWRGRYDHAWQIFHMAMDFAREFDHTDLRCVAGIGMASAHLLTGEDDIALALAEDAVQICEHSGNAWRRAAAYDRIARALLARGDLEMAATTADRGLSLLVRNGWQLREGELRRTRAWIHLAAGETGPARDQAEHAHKLHAECGQRLRQDEDARLLATITGGKRS